MKFAIVSGSHRKNSQTEKVARFIQSMLGHEFAQSSTYLLSLAGNPLPLWDEEAGKLEGKWKDHWGKVSAELVVADAIVIVSPEWSGMVPAGLKNFFLLSNNHELSHKPGLIVTVSAGMGGAYPVAELRMSSYKNTQFCYIPEHVIIRHAQDLLNDATTEASSADAYVRKRLRYALHLLHAYGGALREVRASGVINHADFPYGM